jgi:hypothetical protein
MCLSLLRTRKMSRGAVACADCLRDKNALLRGQDKMDTHEKLSWSVVEQQSQRDSGEKLFYLRKFYIGNVTEIYCFANEET